ncbi:MAG TPA: hypothetical protein VNU28_01450, partial [Solirubrobacteraceae bacterium]|nr:hypothetical protein [Solirubrobacteraceae bacterium]
MSAEQGLSLRLGRPIQLVLIAFAFTLVLALGVLGYAPASSLALSEGRVYEMVTPPYKGGYGGGMVAASPNGENVLFFSLGVFADLQRPKVGSYYVAHRDAEEGWSTSSTEPPFPESGVEEFSSNLEYGVGTISVGGNELEYILHRLTSSDTPPNWEIFPGEVILQPAEAESFFLAGQSSASNDLCHVVIEGNDLLPETPFYMKTKIGDLGNLYNIGSDCRGEAPGLRLVGARNRFGPHREPEAITQECPVILGEGDRSGNAVREAVERATFNAVSDDGSEIFFTTDAEEGRLQSGECLHPQVFVRLGGARTLEVSRSVDPSLPFGGCGEGGSPGEVPGEVPCSGAVSRRPSFFMGASEDGSRVFFTSAERLVGGDTDTTNQLYMARIGCPESEPACEPAARRVLGLTDVSHSWAADEPGEVAGVVSVADDGSRV